MRSKHKSHPRMDLILTSAFFAGAFEFKALVIRDRVAAVAHENFSASALDDWFFEVHGSGRGGTSTCQPERNFAWSCADGFRCSALRARFPARERVLRGECRRGRF